MADPVSPELNAFERATAVAPTSPHRYSAHVGDDFKGPIAPNGGILAATVLRAIEAELGPGAPVPRTVAAHYLEVPAPGEVEIAIEVLRPGRRVTFCDARMFQDGRLVCQATVVCSTSRPAPLEFHAEPPAAPPPELVPPVGRETFAGAPAVFRQLEIRPLFGPAIFSGAPQALTGGWMSLRDDDAPLDAARLCAFCDLWWPAVFGAVQGPVGVPTLQLTVHLRKLEDPVAGPVLARFQSRELNEGHVEESGELWSRDGQLLAESRQLALLTPLPSG